MSRYIDADALCEKMHRMHRASADVQDIKSMPMADVAKVKHGKWEYEDERSAYKDTLVSCSECGAFLELYKKEHFKYCYHCGAKMGE